MATRIRMTETGGPEVLVPTEVDIAPPAPGEVHLRHSAIGLNFIDVYHRTGLYPLPLPVTPGLEGAGEVVAVGPGVSEFAVGDRVAYAGAPPGAYATERVIPAHRLVAVPNGVSDRQAAALMLKGMTARYLLRKTYPVRQGDAILIHAAAGGVGQILCQWANYLGATVIGTVGSPEKAARVKQLGCHHTILYRQEDVAERVREITGGTGVAVVYDSVGADTFDASLASLAPLGMMVSFGQSSGPVPDFEPGRLAAGGSLFLTRPSLLHYTAKRNDLLASAAELFEMVARGVVTVDITATYPLTDIAQAHRDLEARKTTGSVVVLPQTVT